MKRKMGRGQCVSVVMVALLGVAAFWYIGCTTATGGGGGGNNQPQAGEFNADPGLAGEVAVSEGEASQATDQATVGGSLPAAGGTVTASVAPESVTFVEAGAAKSAVAAQAAGREAQITVHIAPSDEMEPCMDEYMVLDFTATEDLDGNEPTISVSDDATAELDDVTAALVLSGDFLICTQVVANFNGRVLIERVDFSSTGPSGNDNGGPDDDMNDNGGPDDDMNDNGGPDDDMNDNGGPDDDMNDNGGPDDDMNDNGGPDDDMNDNGGPDDDMNDNGGPDDDINDNGGDDDDNNVNGDDDGANDNDADDMNDNGDDIGMGDAAAGEAFFADNGCGACHGDDAGGGFGPSLVGEDAADILEVLTGAEDHTGGTVDGITEQDAADLAAWLATL